MGEEPCGNLMFSHIITGAGDGAAAPVRVQMCSDVPPPESEADATDLRLSVTSKR